MIKGIWGNYRSSVDLIWATRMFEILGDNRNVLQGKSVYVPHKNDLGAVIAQTV
jgi:hypothetical protein